MYTHIATIEVIEFIRTNLFRTFDYPGIIMIDNGKQFQNVKITTFCARYGTDDIFPPEVTFK